MAAAPLAPFDYAALTAALGDDACRFDADAVVECDSTNTRLMARAEAGAPSGSVLVADIQTAGRGRRGRIWHSAPGDSLTFSLLWRFTPQSQAPAALSLAVGLAVAQALETQGGRGIALKWPNDVLLAERKLAGILVELVPGAPKSAVIGIGLNLRQPAGLPDELHGSVAAVDELLGMAPSREALLGAVLKAAAAIFDNYAAAGFAALRPAWEAHHAYAGRIVRLIQEPGIERDGRCVGVDDDGALLLDTAAGRERVISGEVSLRPA